MLWYEQGADLGALLPLLATYLGHVGLSSSQYYLRLTEDLLGVVLDRYQDEIRTSYRRKENSMTAAVFSTLVTDFFMAHLGKERNASRHTVMAYRDALKMLLSFAARLCSRTVDRLAFRKSLSGCDPSVS